MEEEHDSTQRLNNKNLTVPIVESHGVALPSGTHIGNFCIDKVLGIGGFGIVYLATQDIVGRKVAIKEFFPSVMVDRVEGQTVKLRATSDLSLFDSGMGSFVKEATILSSLNHPALVQVLHFWQENGTAYMVMPYYEGQSLADKMKDKNFVVSEGFIDQILNGLLPALEYLHQQNIYHRDISPENILLLTNGNPLLLDFGAARQIVEEGMNVTAMLKPSYAPIEQYDKTAKQGAYTDIYALCATLYHLITQKQPQASVTRHLNNYMRILSNDELLLKQYSLGLLQAIDAGLQVLPDARPQTIVEWRDILQKQPLQATPVESNQQKDTAPATVREVYAQEADSNIIVMNPVQKKSKKTNVWLLVLVLCVGSVTYGYFVYSKKNINTNKTDVTDIETVSDTQLMEQYSKINNVLNDEDTKRLKNDLLGLDKQIKPFTPPQVVFELKKKKLILEQEKNSIINAKEQFLKDNHLVWKNMNLKIKKIIMLKEKNDLNAASQLIKEITPLMNDLGDKLAQYQKIEEATNQNLIQKLSGKWALSSCDKDVSNWHVSNNIISVSIANKILASEEIVTITNGVIFTVTQRVTNYPKNIDELFFAYNVGNNVLEIQHLSAIQKLKRC